MCEFVFSASDIVSLVLILIEIKCCNCFEYTEMHGYNIQEVLKAAFGWSGIRNNHSHLIRKTVAQFVLFPKFLFAALAFTIEFGILYSENESEFNIPGGRWTVVGVSFLIYIVFLATMCYFVCCRTDKFKEPIVYFSFLLFYRIWDLIMNFILLMMVAIFGDVDNASSVTMLIYMYCMLEIVLDFIQLCKAVFLVLKIMLEKACSSCLK